MAKRPKLFSIRVPGKCVFVFVCVFFAFSLYRSVAGVKREAQSARTLSIGESAARWAQKTPFFTWPHWQAGYNFS